MRKIIPAFLISLGGVLLVGVFGPIAWQQLRFTLSPQLIDPTAVSGHSVVLVDYTDSSTWFPQADRRPAAASKVRYYTLAIPALDMVDIPVEIEGTDLKKNAIQYAGTAIPGNYGNTVIFGHSTLPQLYKTADPISVFNPLPKTKVGTEVVIKYDGVTYRYLVYETIEVKPDQIEVLAQRYDKHQLTLITCVPLGTYLRRFVARAELVN